MAVSEQMEQRRTAALTLLQGHNGPDINAITALLQTARDDQQIYLGLVGIKMIFTNKLETTQGVLSEMQDIEVPQIPSQ